MLWGVLAFLVWNVVFDRMIVVAGRQYVADATVSARRGRFLLVDDRMKPAVRHAAAVATAAAAGTFAFGFVAIRLAARRRTRSQEVPCQASPTR